VTLKLGETSLLRGCSLSCRWRQDFPRSADIPTDRTMLGILAENILCCQAQSRPLFLTLRSAHRTSAPRAASLDQFSISGELENLPERAHGERADESDPSPRAICAPVGAPPLTSVFFPSNTKEYPRCAAAHLGYDVGYPNRLHNGWGLLGRRRDARLSDQRCPGVGCLPGGQGHTGLTRFMHRVKRLDLSASTIVSDYLGETPKRSRRCRPLR
jgi:hypothetical protein